jgi:hypothetical protein
MHVNHLIRLRFNARKERELALGPVECLREKSRFLALAPPECQLTPWNSKSLLHL